MYGESADPMMDIARTLYGELIAFDASRNRHDNFSSHPSGGGDDNASQAGRKAGSSSTNVRNPSPGSGARRTGNPGPATARAAYTAIGLLLGLGAPAGALLLRMLLFAQARARPLLELRQNAFFYLYSLIGTSLIFAVAGFVAGARAERLRRAEDFYHRLSDIDPLTGLLNSRAFSDRYARVMQRAAKIAEPVALILIDIDRLKDINDEYGHNSGSAALIRVAEAINASKRASDEAARWGGDEFVILLDGGDEAAARRTAEAVRRWLADAPMSDPSVVISVTMGIATGVPANPGDDLFSVADQALYAGKRSGRNQIQMKHL